MPVLMPSLLIAPNLLGVFFLGVAVLVFLLGFAVLMREKPAAVHLSFFVLTSTVTVWLAGIALCVMGGNARTALLGARFSYIGVAAIAAAVFHFTVALLERVPENRTALTVAWTLATVFAFIFATTNSLLSGVWRYSWGFYPRLTSASAIFLAFFVALLIWSIGKLGAELRRPAATARGRKRVRSFFIAMTIGYLGTIDFLPAFGIAVYPIGFLAVGAFLIIAVRTIGNVRLADLTPSFVAEELLQAMNGGVMVVDTRGTIRVANQNLAHTLGYEAKELVGADLCRLLGVDELPLTNSDTFARGLRSRNRPMLWPTRHGTSTEVAVSATMIRDNDRLPIGVLYVTQDLAERRQAERSEYLANHDLLTALPNRALFAKRFEEVIEEVTDRRRFAAVLFIDLDGFKAINDAVGHSAGDSVLQQVARRIRTAVRDDDMVARFGGDEFCVMLSLKSPDDAGGIAEKVLTAIERPYHVGSGIYHLSASIGAALYGRDGTDLTALVSAADDAMYEAKRSGKRAFRMADAPRPSTGTDRQAPPPFTIEGRL